MSVNPSGYIISGIPLQYVINFENTGNDTAFNISIMDTLSLYVEPTSFKIIASSAPMNTQIYYNPLVQRNILTFNFPEINLLDSTHSDQCNGMVIFKINTFPGLPDGTRIFNSAGIFFDNNPGIVTNTAVDIIGNPPTSIPVLQNLHTLSIYPNPANTNLTIQYSDNIHRVDITNLLGMVIYTGSYNSPLVQIDVASLSTGIYFVRVNGNYIRKFLKF